MTTNGPGLGSVFGMVASLVRLQLSVSRMWMAFLDEHIMLSLESVYCSTTAVFWSTTECRAWLQELYTIEHLIMDLG
jgi:hypothetical protein